MPDEIKPFLLRVPEKLLGEVRSWAEQEMRSLNGQIEWILREALKRRRGENDDSNAGPKSRKR